MEYFFFFLQNSLVDEQALEGGKPVFFECLAGCVKDRRSVGHHSCDGRDQNNLSARSVGFSIQWSVSQKSSCIGRTTG